MSRLGPNFMVQCACRLARVPSFGPHFAIMVAYRTRPASSRPHFSTLVSHARCPGPFVSLLVNTWSLLGKFHATIVAWIPSGFNDGRLPRLAVYCTGRARADPSRPPAHLGRGPA